MKRALTALALLALLPWAGAATSVAAEVRYVLPSDEAYQLIADLLSVRRSTRDHAADRLAAEGDLSLLAPVVDVVFFVPRSNREQAFEVLADFTGESLTSYYDWVEYVGAHENISPRPDYWEWKRLLLTRIDPRYGDVLAGNPARSIRLEEVISGGVTLAGIPALDNPPVMPGRRAKYLTPGEKVFGVELDGVVRAYPLRFLSWHELMNDVVGGRAVTLSYCTLCGSGILYGGRQVSGEILTFDTSGLLYRSNKLMVDRQSSSLWSNLTGQPVLGSKLEETEALTQLPMTLTTWGAWFDRHPETEVLDFKALRSHPVQGLRFDYRPGAADQARTGVRFPVWLASKALEEKEEIYGLLVEGTPKAYPMDTLLAERLVHDRVGEVPIVLVTAAGSGAVRVFERGEHRFSWSEDGALIDADGGRWSIGEQALERGAGGDLEELWRIPGHVAFWFGWFAFYPQTEVYGGA